MPYTVERKDFADDWGLWSIRLQRDGERQCRGGRLKIARVIGSIIKWSK